VNKLYITKEQFDTLVNLPAVKERYTFYKQQFTDIVEGSEIASCHKQWIKFAGVDFIAVSDETKGTE
jgi:hypothetical protein